MLVVTKDYLLEYIEFEKLFKKDKEAIALS
jgi:hypothetical protein